ncbi:MAG: two-component system, NarL family, response regulator DegU [Tepidanaerobacteraceae bacterium]|nr:two-component system, NarL family, response regulator DegU [Tepidanaerobacteraceae bacterium]
MEKISVVLADDHVLVRKGLRKILEMEKDIEVVGEASDGPTAIEVIMEKKPQVVLMDINMPKMNGIEVTKILKKERINTNIVILTIYDDREYLLELIKMGIVGYILKDIDPQGLIDAVRSASRGEAYIQPNLTRALIAEYNRMTQPVVGAKKPLTAREKEVMAYIADGLNNSEISSKLNISEKTVKNHVSSILRKLNLQDRTQVAVFALKNKLV